MASISAVRDGLKARLQTLSGMHAYDTVPGQIQTPAAIIEPDDPVILYDSTMGRGSDDLFFLVTVLASDGSMRVAQDSVDALLATTGPGSVKAAVEGDATLGGIVSFARVTEAVGYGEYEFNQVPYPGVRFKIQITT